MRPASTSATYGRMIPTSVPSSPTSLRSARTAGVAMTTSPTQLGKKTPRRIRALPVPQAVNHPAADYTRPGASEQRKLPATRRC